MKRIFLFLTVILLGIIGINSAKAQSESDLIGKVWVLQNPELAVSCAVITFYSNGQMLQKTVNLLTKKESSLQFFWKLDEKNRLLTISSSNGGSYVGEIIFSDKTFTIMSGNNADFIFAISGSSSDYYLSRVKNAVNMYGNDASMKKNGFPSSSRETGYSFLPRYSPCFSCGGTGKCFNCQGSGMVTYDFREYKTCPNCSGAGACWSCGGRGRIKNY